MAKIARKFVLIYLKKEKRIQSKGIILLPINKADVTEMQIYIIIYIAKLEQIF